MKLEAFFEKFELFADAPDAVAKMRELVLELAVRGSLTEQEKSDQENEPWRHFLEEFDTRVYGYDPGPPPFEIPDEWRWACLDDIAKPCGQKTPDKRFTYIDVGSIDNTRGELKSELKIIEIADAPSRARKLAKRGSVIYATVRPYLKNIAVIDKDFNPPAIISTAFAILHPLPFVESRFLFYWLRSSAFEREVSAYAKGVAYPAISDGDLKGCLVPIPPLAEQKRIVAKVVELMMLCDRLEAQQQEREIRRAALARASLARFADAPTPANLHFIFHKSYDISPADLRKSILNLAVQGKLVPQDSNDEPAEAILVRIAATKLRLQKTSEIVKEKHVEPLQPESLPFETPESWQWVKLAELTELITKGSSPKWQGIAYVSEPEGILFITSENVGNYVLRKLDDLKYVSKGFNEIEPRSILKRGDILMNLVGASIGRTAVYDLHDGANINQAVALIRLVRETDGICPRFLLHYLNSPSAVDYMLSSRVVNAQPNISLTDAREFAIPLPPLAEQHRIVAKVDQLMALVDELETQLAASRASAANLLSALVAELTSQSEELLTQRR